MTLHTDPGLSVAVEGLRVRVRCRPDRSQFNHGRTGRVRRACVHPETYEVEFDEPDHRGCNWDFVHGEDLVVTGHMNGHEIEKDDLSIPEFLLAKNQSRQPETREDRAAREKILASAKRGSEAVTRTPEQRSARSSWRVPKGGVDPKFAAELAEKAARDAAVRAAQSAEKKAERAAERRAVDSARPRMLTFRQAVLALRELDPARWGKLTRAKLGPMLDKAGWPRRDGEYRFLAAEVEEVARLLGGGKVAPPAKTAPAEGSVAPAVSPGTAKAAPKPPKPARGRALRGSQPVPAGMGKRARGR